VNSSPISAWAALEHLRELRREAPRRDVAPRRAAEEPVLRGVSIRYAGPSDAPLLLALATLDSKPVPTGDVLVAEVDGAPGAALSLTDGTAIADPFRHTADLVHILELRAAQLRAAATPPRRRRRALALVRRRAAAGR
jgi:hypothetical protein